MRPSNAFEPLVARDLEQPLARRFEWQVDRAPERLALSTDDGDLSYAALDRWANRIAAAVRARLGDAPQPVALCFRQGAAAVAAILGALKARKFWVPLDPRAPLAQAARVLDECGAALLLTERASAECARALAGPRGASLVDVEACASGLGDARPALELSADDLAYVFYTSGSTGRPKGVCDTQRNVAHNVLRYTNSLHLCREDRLTLIQACSFSGTVSSLFGALLNGACLLPFDFAGASPGQLADWIERSRPTVYHSVPAIFRSLFVAGPRAFPSLRLIRLEGDQSSARDLELHRQHFPASCLLVNGLGTTETGLVAQYFVSTDSAERPLVVPVGRAVEGVALRVLDPGGRPCPAGEVGEIAVSSRYLAQGYWGQPELTRARFGEDPDGEPGARLYRTGDLGRWRPDGCLEHLGRSDARARIHGQWVELAEVEARLLALDGVKEAVVTTLADALGARLVAYLVPSVKPAPAAAALRRALEERLPPASIPSRFVWLDALPLGPAGKLDRGALPPPDAGAPGREPLAPRNLVELRVSQLWEQILEVAPIGTRDDFFELGGDSLRAVLLLDALERDFGRRLASSVLLEARSVEALAEVLRSGAALQPLVALQPGSPGATPFFFFHGDYLGGGLYCHALAEQLGSALPFYAMTPCGVGTGPLPPSYAEMARHHLEVLRAAVPRGPYRLGGNCNGGLVAFEVARLLEAGGERVERLVLISASAANLRFAALRAAVEVAGRALGARPEARAALFRRLRELGLRLEATPARARLASLARSAARLPDALADLRRPAPPVPAAGPGRWDPGSLRERYLEIDADYLPPRYGGPICLIWPETDPEPAELAARRWRRRSASVALHVVPGSHTSCVTAHVEVLAARIRACLA